MKLRYKILIILSLIFSVNILNADCESAKKEGEFVGYYISRATLSTEVNEIYLMLFTDEVYYEISNDYDNNVEIKTYSDLNEEGYISIISPDNLTNIKYTVKTYYTDRTCGEEVITTKEIETGIYNKNFDNKECWHKSYLDVCKYNYSAEELKEYENIQTDSELKEKIEEEQKEYDKENEKTTLDIIKEYYLYVLIPILVISVFYIIRIIIIKKRKEVKDED